MASSSSESIARGNKRKSGDRLEYELSFPAEAREEGFLYQAAEVAETKQMEDAQQAARKHMRDRRFSPDGSAPKMTKEQRERKRMINRLSAQRKRQRERFQIDTLSHQYSKYAHLNATLTADNNRLEKLEETMKSCLPTISSIPNGVLSHIALMTKIDQLDRLRSVLIECIESMEPTQVESVDPVLGLANESTDSQRVQSPFGTTTKFLKEKLSILDAAKEIILQSVSRQQQSDQQMSALIQQPVQLPQLGAITGTTGANVNLPSSPLIRSAIDASGTDSLLSQLLRSPNSGLSTAIHQRANCAENRDEQLLRVLSGLSGAPGNTVASETAASFVHSREQHLAQLLGGLDHMDRSVALSRLTSGNKNAALAPAPHGSPLSLPLANTNGTSAQSNAERLLMAMNILGHPAKPPVQYTPNLSGSGLDPAMMSLLLSQVPLSKQLTVAQQLTHPPREQLHTPRQLLGNAVQQGNVNCSTDPLLSRLDNGLLWSVLGQSHQQQIQMSNFSGLLASSSAPGTIANQPQTSAHQMGEFLSSLLRARPPT